MIELYKRAAPHIDRVRLDGGVPTDNVQELLLLKRSNEELKNVLRLSYCPELHGNKIRTSGINNFITKGYDEATSNDLTQTSSASQLFLDKIAPTEKLSAKNTNASPVCSLVHSPITFTGANKWTIEVTSNFYGGTIYASQMGNNECAFFNRQADMRYRFVNASAVGMDFAPTTFSQRWIGKTTVITLSASGDGMVRMYINGLYVASATIESSVVLNWIQRGRGSNFDGNIFSYHVFSDALNAQQVAERASVLRSIFPEIPFTRIGDQIWSVRNYEAVCTPQGTLIPEVQPASNVEKITNAADREFSSDTGWWLKSGETTIANGICNIKTTTGTTSGIEKATLLTNGKWYRLKYDVIANRNGGLQIFNGSSVQSISSTVENNKLFYFYAGGAYFNIARTGSVVDIDIDNISVQEIGWLGSQELYDGIYAQTVGTVEQKTYAAVKAAAMWCHYNNDATLGATYGKLYNWFAVKLLQMDIDYFNAANPTTPWGWRVPAQADFQTLSTYLGGDDVSGGKLKLAGTTYWESPNTGATNESGFTAIPSALRYESGGGFIDTNISFSLHSITEISGAISRLMLRSNTTATDRAAHPKIRGCSLRLIKN